MKVGFSSEFAAGFDEVLNGDDLEFMLDDLLVRNSRPNLVTDFLGAPLEIYDEQNIDELISDLQDHPLVRGNQIKNEQDTILSEMGPGMLTKEERQRKLRELDRLSDEQERNFADVELVLIYRTQQDGRVDDIHCLPLEGEVFMSSDPVRPVIPKDLHPNCRCYWEDAETGENLGQF